MISVTLSIELTEAFFYLYVLSKDISCLYFLIFFDPCPSEGSIKLNTVCLSTPQFGIFLRNGSLVFFLYWVDNSNI